MAKFTPGPWKIYYDNYTDHTDTLIIADTPAPQTVIAEVKWHISTPIGEDEANARLIAAAPELVETVKALLPFILEDGVPEQYWTPELKQAVDAARAVLAKVEGR